MFDDRFIDRPTLERKMARAAPDNVSKSRGYALINVLEPRAFIARHIPHSINVPVEGIDMLEDVFSKDKEIIVYSESADSDAAPRAVRALRERGFANVYGYTQGLRDWSSAGNRLTRAPA